MDQTLNNLCGKSSDLTLANWPFCAGVKGDLQYPAITIFFMMLSPYVMNFPLNELV